METAKGSSWLFALIGTALAIAAIAIGLGSLNAPPRLLKAPEAAVQAADAMLAAVCEGNHAAAADRMYGKPDLGVDRQPDSKVGILIWNAFVDSLEYEFIGECYATESGLAQDVRITGLDLSSVTDVLGERSMVLLEERVANAEDVEQIYDENNEYREDFVMDVLYDAAAQALEHDAKLVSREITLNLVYQRGQWQIMPEPALLSTISGGIAG